MATSSTDVNGKTTSVTYSDPYFWRPASSQDPTTAQTNFAYTPPTRVESYMSFGSSITEQMTTFDSFGRVSVSQRQQAPGVTSFDTTETDYDNVGRPSRITMPYVSTSYGQTNPSAPAATTSYDALGRATQVADAGGGYVSYAYSQNDVLQTHGPAPAGENTKKKQMEYDALGRLTSVCEVTQGTGYGSCAQTTGYNGYWTKYAYDFSGGYNRVTVTQNAQSGSPQTRTYLYDLVGRLVSETNPENGTTSYIYDTTGPSSCSGSWSYLGDLVRKVDAIGTNTCYYYDAIHRLTDVGTNRGIDGCRRFRYDNSAGVQGSRPTGISISNSLGRPVEVETDNCTLPVVPLTDEWLSYSSRGEVTDVWESTPHSGSYYHVASAYWANGAVQSLSSNITGLPSQTYGVDGEGRPYSVTASSGQNPVTSTSYNLSTFTTTVNFGLSDSDVFTADPNTGRMTQYKFNVGSNSDTGTLTWNPNGSLGQLAIADTVPSTADTQTCSYTHDDLARVASVNCLNGATNKWNQAFNYDAFGNTTKTTSGPGIAFMPGYSTATNWITSLPGVTPTTDANGRMTYDGVHSYAWDADGHMLSVDTTTITYDALGRMVEKNVSGTYTQTVYGPQGGKFAVMSDSTLQQAFMPLPTGATAVYNSSGLAYYRHPDHLGSSRLATTPSRTLYSSTSYAPFGEAYAQAGTADSSFTGQDQGTVSGMHDFLDRRFMPVQGRWLSPDPIGLAAVDLTNPQSWNRYAYVLNNPLATIDLFGDDGCYSTGLFINGVPVRDPSIFCDPVPSPGLWPNVGNTIDAGGGGSSGDIPSTTAAKPPTGANGKPCPPSTAGSNIVNRVVAGATGAANVVLGPIKVAEGLAVDAAGPLAGPAAPIAEVVGGYRIWNGGGQTIAGLASLDFAFTGNERAENLSNQAIGMSTLSGLLTYTFTGNWKTAGTVGSIENGVPSVTGIPQAAEPLNSLVETANKLLQGGRPRCP